MKRITPMRPIIKSKDHLRKGRHKKQGQISAEERKKLEKELQKQEKLDIKSIEKRNATKKPKKK